MRALPLAERRESYRRGSLSRDELPPDPLILFRTWFAEAEAADVMEPNAMTLATASPDGRPSARIVLLKGLGPRGFTFYTNLESRKGRELDANPQAALTFWWPPLERQVRVEGCVEQIDEDTASDYYASRPRGSRIGAWASPQSQQMESRAALEDRVREVEARFEGDEAIPKPPFWSGFRVVPQVVEFWQGRPSRLHDRFVYRHNAQGGWTIFRLAP